MSTIVSGNGGGGVSSSELTTIAANVLAGTKYVGSDTDDDFGYGTMPNKAGSTSASGGNSYNTSNNRVIIKIPEIGYYNTSSTLYVPTSTFGNATADQVLNGRTFTSSGSGQLAKPGTMPNKNGVAVAATPSWDASTDSNKPRVQMKISSINNNGYYTTSSSLYSLASNFGTVSANNVLKDQTFTSNKGLNIKGTMSNYKNNGLDDFITSTYRTNQGAGRYLFYTPNKEGCYSTNTYIRIDLQGHLPNLSSGNIKKGVVIGGVTGDFEGYVATNKEIYDNGTWGSGYGTSTINKSSDSYWVLTYDSTCIICDWTRSGQAWTSTDGVYIFSKTKPLNASAYSNITIQTSCQATSGYSDEVPNKIYLKVYNVNDTEIASGDVTYTAKDTKVNVTVSLASITQSVYFKLYTYSRDNYPGGSWQYSPDFTIYSIKLT